jgi:hypothetical protein
MSETMQNRSDTTSQRIPTERGDVAPEHEQPTVAAREREAQTQTQQQQQRVDLLPREVLSEFRGRWESVQTGFVDEPRRAVQNAHDLVDQLVERLAETFRRERDRLEGTWSSGADVSTEDLRIALQRYRSFFDRLLST